MNFGKGIKIAAGLFISAVAGYYFLRQNTDPIKYSKKWFETLSEEEFDAMREDIRKRLAKEQEDKEYQSLKRKMDYMDEIWRKKNDTGGPWVGPPHTEHGWYLSEDDWDY